MPALVSELSGNDIRERGSVAYYPEKHAILQENKNAANMI